jgi:hypothetical protein
MDPASLTTRQAAAEECRLGWRRLAAGEAVLAAERFQAALELAPEFEEARRGLLACIELDHPVLRWLIRYQRWVAGLDRALYWPFLLLIFLASQILALVAQRAPQHGGWISVLLLAMLCFALVTWIGDPVTHTALRLHRWGRASLTRQQARASNSILVLGCIALTAIALGRVLRSAIFFVIAGFAVLLALPATQALGLADSPGARRLIRYVEAMALLAGLATAGVYWRSPLGGVAGVLFVAAFFAFTWYANRVLNRGE